MVFLEMTLRDIRNKASEYGIAYDADTSRAALCAAIRAKEQENAERAAATAAETERLRSECVRRGLAADGEPETLRLRLVASDPATVTPADRRLYNRAAVIFATLGVSALVVSLPHIACELRALTGLSLFAAVALAAVIDCGILASKMLDVLSVKFNLASLRPFNRAAMVACLAFSAAINYSGFVRADGNAALSAAVAVFLPAIAWFSFLASAYLATRCERKGETATAAECPATRLERAARELRRLQAIADRV